MQSEAVNLRNQRWNQNP